MQLLQSTDAACISAGQLYAAFRVCKGGLGG